MHRSTLLGLLALLLWSTTVAASRSLAEKLGPLTAGAAVCLFAGTLGLLAQLKATGYRRQATGPQAIRTSADTAACSLWPAAFFIHHSSFIIHHFLALPRRYLIGCGALFIVYTVCLYVAIGLAADRTQVLAVGLLNYLWPGLTILFSLPLLKRKARAGLAPGTLLALCGVFLVIMQGSGVSLRALAGNLSASPVVFALGLIAAISWALYSNLARLWGGQQADGAVPAFFLASGLVLLAVRMLRPEVSTFSARAGAELAFLSTATALGYVFWDVSMRRGNAVLVVACSYAMPLLSTAISCAYLGIVPARSLWLGCLLIIGGSVLSRLSIEEAAAPAPSSRQSISP